MCYDLRYIIFLKKSRLSMLTQEQKFNIDIIPSAFKLQWHITEKCNFRCIHCYQESYSTPEMTFKQMTEVLEQYKALIKKWGIPRNCAFLTITGGEPFLRQDFFSFLTKVAEYSENFLWEILSNGSLVTKDNAKTLKKLGISGFQVSLEGLEENNDKIRGKGYFKKAIGAIKILTKEDIPIVIGLTASKENIKDISSLAEMLSEIKVRILWVRRLINIGQAPSGLKSEMLDSPTLFKLFKEIEKINDKLYSQGSGLRVLTGCESAIFNPYREISPWNRGDNWCLTLKGEILALMPNGDVYPCRRLPIKVGNVLEQSLEKIYYSEYLKELRDFQKLPDYCRNVCYNVNRCFGGARCVNYASEGRFDMPDVQCWNAPQK